MNDRWTDVASSTIADAAHELAEVQARLDALPLHCAAAAGLRLRAADLGHRIAAASRVLDAYGHAGAPGERDDEGAGVSCPAPAARAMGQREAA